MTPKQTRERKFAIMKQRSHPNSQPRDVYQDAHLQRADRYHDAWVQHVAEIELFATRQTRALEQIVTVLSK